MNMDLNYLPLILFLLGCVSGREVDQEIGGGLSNEEEEGSRRASDPAKVGSSSGGKIDIRNLKVSVPIISNLINQSLINLQKESMLRRQSLRENIFKKLLLPLPPVVEDKEQREISKIDKGVNSPKVLEDNQVGLNHTTGLKKSVTTEFPYTKLETDLASTRHESETAQHNISSNLSERFANQNQEQTIVKDPKNRAKLFNSQQINVGEENKVHVTDEYKRDQESSDVPSASTKQVKQSYASRGGDYRVRDGDGVAGSKEVNYTGPSNSFLHSGSQSRGDKSGTEPHKHSFNYEFNEGHHSKVPVHKTATQRYTPGIVQNDDFRNHHAYIFLPTNKSKNQSITLTIKTNSIPAITVYPETLAYKKTYFPTVNGMKNDASSLVAPVFRMENNAATTATKMENNANTPVTKANSTKMENNQDTAGTKATAAKVETDSDNTDTPATKMENNADTPVTKATTAKMENNADTTGTKATAAKVENDSDSTVIKAPPILLENNVNTTATKGTAAKVENNAVTTATKGTAAIMEDNAVTTATKGTTVIMENNAVTTATKGTTVIMENSSDTTATKPTALKEEINADTKATNATAAIMENNAVTTSTKGTTVIMENSSDTTATKPTALKEEINADTKAKNATAAIMKNNADIAPTKDTAAKVENNDNTTATIGATAIMENNAVTTATKMENNAVTTATKMENNAVTTATKMENNTVTTNTKGTAAIMENNAVAIATKGTATVIMENNADTTATNATAAITKINASTTATKDTAAKVENNANTTVTNSTAAIMENNADTTAANATAAITENNAVTTAAIMENNAVTMAAIMENNEITTATEGATALMENNADSTSTKGTSGIMENIANTTSTEGTAGKVENNANTTATKATTIMANKADTPVLKPPVKNVDENSSKAQLTKENTGFKAIDEDIKLPTVNWDGVVQVENHAASVGSQAPEVGDTAITVALRTDAGTTESDIYWYLEDPAGNRPLYRRRGFNKPQNVGNMYPYPSYNLFYDNPKPVSSIGSGNSKTVYVYYYPPDY